MSGAPYTVLLHRHARADLEAAFTFAAQHAPETAFAWLTRFHEQLGSLSHDPLRYGRATESQRLGRDLRQMLFGRRRGVYRVIFLVDDRVVRIVRVLRAAQRPLSASQLNATLEDG